MRLTHKSTPHGRFRDPRHAPAPLRAVRLNLSTAQRLTHPQTSPRTVSSPSPNTCPRHAAPRRLRVVPIDAFTGIERYWAVLCSPPQAGCLLSQFICLYACIEGHGKAATGKPAQAGCLFFHCKYMYAHLYRWWGLPGQPAPGWLLAFPMFLFICMCVHVQRHGRAGLGSPPRAGCLLSLLLCIYECI